jgi:hypothetical protein
MAQHGASPCVAVGDPRCLRAFPKRRPGAIRPLGCRGTLRPTFAGTASVTRAFKTAVLAARSTAYISGGCLGEASHVDLIEGNTSRRARREVAFSALLRSAAGPGVNTRLHDAQRHSCTFFPPRSSSRQVVPAAVRTYFGVLHRGGRERCEIYSLTYHAPRIAHAYWRPCTSRILEEDADRGIERYLRARLR